MSSKLVLVASVTNFISGAPRTLTGADARNLWGLMKKKKKKRKNRVSVRIALNNINSSTTSFTVLRFLGRALIVGEKKKTA